MNELEKAYGGVVIKDNRILLREPTNHYDGYVWTFPKGRGDKGETPVETALREVFEETGVIAEVIEPVAGEFIGGTTSNQYYLMQPVEETGIFDWETNAIQYVTVDEAFILINKTINETGRKRDLAILQAIKPLLCTR